MNKDIDELIKAKQYWKARSKELAQQLIQARKEPAIQDLLCKDCNGEGTRYDDTSGNCMTAPSECCGGCGHEYECETCDGTGESKPVQMITIDESISIVHDALNELCEFEDQDAKINFIIEVVKYYQKEVQQLTT